MSKASHEVSPAADRFAREQPFELPDNIPPHNEGQTVAAWFAMIGIIVGMAVATVGFCLSSVVVTSIGGALVLGALVGGWLLRQAGHGQKH